jgi:1-acyl-sn-glycerol-3-phosphate acyltransferase
MRLKSYHPAWWRRWIARPVLRVILRGIFRILAPVRITGRANVPHGKAYIVAINHVSIFDPPFAGVFWPEQVEAMGAAEVWNKPGQNVLARLWGGIPVHRGDYDRAMFETVLAVLRSGYPLLIAPEGGRSHVPGLRQAKPGIATIAELSGMPVIPVAIVGTTDDFWKKATRGERPVLEMHIGRPLLLKPANSPGADRRAARQDNADLVMRTIAGMLPDAYRGVYADRAILPESKSDH